MNTTTKIILGILGLGVVGVGGYFLYRKMNTTTENIKDAEYVEVQQELPNVAATKQATVGNKEEPTLPKGLGIIGETKTTLTQAEAQAKQKQFKAKGKVDVFGDLTKNYKGS
jgi:hypothetical protein